MVRLFLVAFAILMLAGCGGGSGGGGGLPQERPYVETSGYAVDAVIEGGTVTAYSWKGGAKGDALGSAVTDENGHYSISIQAEPQPVLLELTGGTYVEEASGQRITLKADQYLYAAMNYGGNIIEIMITPFTTLAVGLAKFYVSNGENVENAITKAQSEITGITVFNILEEYPVNITLDANRTDQLTDGHMYGFFCAALSSWAAELSEENGTGIHEVYTSVYLTQLMYRDVKHDGVLEGFGIASNDRPGNISVGSVPLDSQSYRFKIGYHILRAAGADYNGTGLTVSDVLEQAHMFSQRKNALFGMIDPLPLDVEGPKVYRTEPIGQQYRGVVEFGFRIEDPVGIQSMTVSLDGDPLDAKVSENSTGEDVTVTINTTDYSDGDHVLTIVSSDLLGNESVHEQNVYVNNSGIQLNVDELPELTRAGSIEVSGTYETTGTLIEGITVNGEPATVQTQSQTWSTAFTLESGVNEIEIIATDVIGNETTVNRTVNCDRVSPEIETGDNHGYHRFYIGEGDVTSLVLHDENTGDPLYFNYENTSLNGIEVNKEDLKSAEIPFFKFFTSDSSDNGVFTEDNELTVSMTYSKGGEEQSNRTLSPLADTTNEYIIPLVNEYLNQDFYQTEEDTIHSIRVRVVDNAGNASAKIFTFKVYVDAEQLTVRSLNNTSNVTVYAFDTGTKGGVIAQGKTDSDGNATLKLFSDARPILVELTGGSYIETGTGSGVQLSEGQKLSAVANFKAQDLTVNVTPLTNTAAALAVQSANDYPTVQEAVTAANADVSKIYGVDIINAGIVDISDPNNASGECTDAHRHSFILAGLSMWTSDAASSNDAHNQQYYNSVLLAEKMADDMADDGQLNGGQQFGSVPIDATVYQSGFGDATVKVVASQRNATQLGMEDFIGSNFNVADAGEELQLLGASFAARSTAINRELFSTRYTLTNSSNRSLFFQVDNNIGQQNSCRHEFFDAVREHVVHRHRELRYRGRAVEGTTPSCEEIYYEWQPITKYATWENQRWNTIVLPTTEDIDLNHNSDALPGERYQPWEYFITENVGELKNYAFHSDNPNHYLTGCSGSDPRRFEQLYDYWLPEYKHPLSVTNSLDYWCKAWGNFKHYTGPHHESDGGRIWWVTPDQFQYLTQRLDMPVTPQIQRDYTETFSTVEPPHNEITAENTQDHPFQATRYTVENGSGAQVPAEMGYYIIAPGGTIVIKKYITTPNIQLYSGEQPSYTPTTFDKSLTWTIDKSISVSVIQADSLEGVEQMPVYELAHSGNKTYTMAR